MIGGSAARVARACLLAAPFIGCGSLIEVPDLPPVPPDLYDRAFTAEEVAADVDALFSVIEEVHPGPYGIVSREAMRERRQALLAGLDAPLTRRQLQPMLAELVAALGDGHTSVHLPMQEFWRDQAADGCFPVDVAWDGAGLVVRRTAAVTADGALAPGARLLRIGERPAPDVFRSFLARTSGETEGWRVAGVERRFAVLLWLDGARPPYPVRVASALDPSREFGVELPGLPWGAVARGAAPGGGAPWRLEHRDDGVAVLTLDSLAGDLGRFEDFLEEQFGSLADHPPSALVIDLRRNGGGDSRLGDELLQYLSDAPWRQAARKEWKVSARLKAHLKSLLPAWLRWLPVQYLHPTGRTLWGTPEGEVAVLEEPSLAPRDEPLRYHGPLAWLTGPETFSSAMSLACGARDCGRGLLVGAETGGVVNGFGEVYPFQLPNTRLGVQVSTAWFVHAGGEPDRRGGVRPDVAAWPGPGEDGDPVLDAAIATLRARAAQAVDGSPAAD